MATNQKEKSLFNYMFYVCPACGKEFFCRDRREWGYKRKELPFCSYPCVRQYDKVSEREQKTMLKNAKRRKTGFAVKNPKKKKNDEETSV